MFSTEITKSEAFGSTFEVKFTNLSFSPHSDGNTYLILSFTCPTSTEESTTPTISINRYQVTRNQGYSFWGSVDIHTGQDVGSLGFHVVPTTFTIVTVDNSRIDNERMEFKVTFGRNEAKVLRLISGGVGHIELRYTVSQVNKHFSFRNANSRENTNLMVATELRYDQNAAEAFKVGIFMLILGSMGHKKLQQDQTPHTIVGYPPQASRDTESTEVMRTT